LSSELEALTKAITEARTTLRATRVVGPHHFLLTALAGYLWNAIAVADTLLVVVKSGAGRGAGSLQRLLHESYIDAMFLASDPDADLLRENAMGERDERGASDRSRPFPSSRHHVGLIVPSGRLTNHALGVPVSIEAVSLTHRRRLSLGERGPRGTASRCSTMRPLRGRNIAEY